MKGLAGALSVVVFLICGAPSRASTPEFFPFQPDEEMMELVSRAAALALIHDLALTAEQRGEIRRILKPLRDEIDRLQEEEEAFRNERIKPRLRKVIEELKAGRDPAAALSAESEEEMSAFRDRMAGLLTKSDRAYRSVQAVLTPAQQERLRGFRFEEYIGPLPRKRPAGRLGMEPEALILEIRTASPEEIDALVARIERRREARKEAAGNGKRAARVDRKVEKLVDLVKQIHAMPQEAFDARREQLRMELDLLSPPGPGPAGRHGPGRPPGAGGFADSGFGAKRILFSKAFYEAL